MVYVLTLPDGRDEILVDLRDFLDLVDQCMGSEARCWLAGYLAENYLEDHETEAYEKEIEAVTEHYQSVLRDLRELSEELAKLIRAERLDRKRISTVAGKIGTLTWKNLRS